MKILNFKYLSLRSAILALLLFTFIFSVMRTEKVYAQTVKDTVTNTTEDKRTDNGVANVNGSLGPLQFTLNTDEDSNSLSSTLQMLIVLTVIALAPSILIMVTSFTRILIVLHFARSAIGTTTTPPNQILTGLALFLTFFIMSPVFTQINNEALKPLSEGTITQEEAFDKGLAPIRTFMLEQAKTKDIRLFLDIAQIAEVKTTDDIPTTVLIPAFIISELRTAFIIGFLIYIPFIIIDMVVASTLMSMGMMMLPPTMISMPFKILLFILADGWNLIIGQLVKTFY